MTTGISTCTTEHALDCRFDNLVGPQHNEIHTPVHDTIGDLASLVWGYVVYEPMICDHLASSDRVLHSC